MKFLPLLWAVSLLAPSAWAQLTSAQKDAIGFTSLQTRLGVDMPTGAGISVSQVEAPEASTHYRPNTADAQLAGKTFEFPSGGSTGSSSHATTVGRYFYGSSSLAPQAGATVQGGKVTSYEANNWLGSGFLRTGTPSVLPLVEANDIQNHSWIGSAGASDAEILRRVDYAIERDDFIAVFGLNNGSATTVPSLMASSYNGITVGLSNGAHSRGGTLIEGAGRTRPDLVVPTSLTSWAAPTVGSAAALLLETARSTSGLGNGDKSEVVKSLLLTGATRVETFSGWSHTPTQPLDAVYGAGQLNIDRSHHILTAGEFSPSASSLAGNTGWSFTTASSSTPRLYFFDLTDPNALEYEVEASLVWNRNVIATDTQPGPGVSYSWSYELSNLDLRLYGATGFTLGSLISASLSSIDNVELIEFGGLAPGRYALEVSSSDPAFREYALSWNSTLMAVIPEVNSFAMLLIAGAAFAGVRLLKRNPASAQMRLQQRVDGP